MFEFALLWVFALLPLPWLMRWLLPPADKKTDRLERF